MLCWEIIADKLHRDGWTWGSCAALGKNGETLFVVDAHRDDGTRFIVHSDEKLTAFLELERVVRAATESPKDA